MYQEEYANYYLMAPHLMNLMKLRDTVAPVKNLATIDIDTNTKLFIHDRINY